MENKDLSSDPLVGHDMLVSKKLRPVESEGSQCTCGSDWEHSLLVASVDDSYVKDVERAKLRQERNTHWLRMQVLKELNGHDDAA